LPQVSVHTLHAHKFATLNTYNTRHVHVMYTSCTRHVHVTRQQSGSPNRQFIVELHARSPAHSLSVHSSQCCLLPPPTTSFPRLRGVGVGVGVAVPPSRCVSSVHISASAYDPPPTPPLPLLSGQRVDVSGSVSMCVPVDVACGGDGWPCILPTYRRMTPQSCAVREKVNKCTNCACHSSNKTNKKTKHKINTKLPSQSPSTNNFCRNVFECQRQQNGCQCAATAGFSCQRQRAHQQIGAQYRSLQPQGRCG